MLRHVSVWVLDRKKKKHFFTSSTTILTPTGACIHTLSLFSLFSLVVPFAVSYTHQTRKGPNKAAGATR